MCPLARKIIYWHHTFLMCVDDGSRLLPSLVSVGYIFTECESEGFRKPEHEALIICKKKRNKRNGNTLD